MLRRHIDFFAVFFIAVTLFAFSQLPSLRIPDFGDSVQMQNALTNIDSCPTTRAILARLGY
jgi:hypothetical protein